MASSSTKSLKSVSKKLPRSFYARHTLDVATDLLGKVLLVQDRKQILSGLIVETEAYFGQDPASHSSQGKHTVSGKVRKCIQMFETPGTAYVYAAHLGRPMLNVVARSKDYESGAVLIRAVEPLQGLNAMVKKRHLDLFAPKSFATGLNDQEIDPRVSNGPAKLCEAMGIKLSDNGSDLAGARIWITESLLQRSFKIASSPRIGIRFATEVHWRFFIEGHPFVTPNAKINRQSAVWKKHRSYRDLNV